MFDKKEVELFDKRFVHFMWDDSLEGKEGFFADNMGDLRDFVNNAEPYIRKVRANSESDSNEYPFRSTVGCKWRFFYYDPNYDVKWAFYKEGKTVQYKSLGGNWIDITDKCEPTWDYEYRIKSKAMTLYRIMCGDCKMLFWVRKCEHKYNCPCCKSSACVPLAEQHFKEIK